MLLLCDAGLAPAPSLSRCARKPRKCLGPGYGALKHMAYADPTGEFHREAAKFRNWVTKDGAPGPAGAGGFKAEPGRYHLYVSLACPWAHRTLIMRRLKGLED